MAWRRQAEGLLAAGRILGLGLVVFAAAAVAEGDAAPRLRIASGAPARSAEGLLEEHLGVAVDRGRMAPILRAGRACDPCERTVDYATAVDDQTEIPIVLLRGRDTAAESVTPVGALMIRGLSPRAAGRGHVKVTIGVEGRDVWVAAREAATGRPLEVDRVDAPARPAAR